MKKANITKRYHAYKNYANIYNVEILNSFNPKLQYKSNDFTIKIKLKKLLTELRRFEFVTTSVIQFEKMESDDTTKHDIFFLIKSRNNYS